ncbi:hypothetical protein BD289DRAFT_509423 [Coniella lustricola]|uniref:PQ loop repeat-domain-containing protein n=1 Tax=Coniella lustricola TaxID=2025994 RepID=A0A2T2ZUX7_9PEZI|nr:hypothetical protein BD289DRAFT_509423 [Coniella lustricola]
MIFHLFSASGAPSQPAVCRALNYVDYTNFGISLALLIGILLSYFPQHFRIISRGTSFGLSPYFVLLGTTSATAAFANIIVLPPSRTSIDCCRVISGFACTAGLLGIAQITVQWLCFGLITILFLVYFPKATPNTPHPESDPQPPSYRSAVIVVLICLVFALAIGIASAVVVLQQSPHAAWQWANALGITATALASIQYFPQIYTTYKLKSLGSLSIPMMCVQTPGGFLWAASLAARLGWEGWSAWILYVFISTLQGVVLGMGLWYKWKGKGKGQEEDEEEVEEEVEEEGESQGGGGGGGGQRREDEENAPLLANRE